MGDMTEVAGWARKLTEDVLGGAPLEVGRRYVHPVDGEIDVIAGQYWGRHGLSNHWTWRVVTTGEVKNGYGGNWPQAPTGVRCRYVTGRSAPAHLRTLDPSRRGGQRENGDYDVLCGSLATWLVERPNADSITTCDRDLPHVIEDQAVVTRITP